MANQQRQIAVFYPSGSIKLSEGEKLARLQAIAKLGFEVHDLPVFHPASDGCAAATAVERAAMVSHALTRRMYQVAWAARGGAGATALVPFLSQMLPPVLPEKILVGFSDVSFLGVSLALQYPSLSYVHARHVFAADLFSCDRQESTLLDEILGGRNPAPREFASTLVNPKSLRDTSAKGQPCMEGPCIPLNLSLAESLLAFREFRFPQNTVLFLEDCTEPVFRLLRKFDGLVNSGLLANVAGIVVGCFTDCKRPDGTDVSPAEMAAFIAERTSVPVWLLPIFGHGAANIPLVALSKVSIRRSSQEGAESHAREDYSIQLNFSRAYHDPVCSLYGPQVLSSRMPRLHFTGVGGTGMASVAGLFQQGGYAITGSDTPIFPPMDKVIADMGIHLCVGYEAKNIDQVDPEVVVLSNVISRKNANLQGNPELERILEKNVPMLSFPSALRRFFLSKSQNIVVTGTHGKTTTTSLIAQTLRSMGHDPSLFVGGASKNFNYGYHLGSPHLFVLEGDEYDTAYFDKGPKYLHYEPTVALLNNIEFDHADIYADVEAIEREFLRLASYTRQRGGIAVVNLLDPRVVKVARESGVTVMAFGQWSLDVPASSFGAAKAQAPGWYLESFVTQMDGTLIHIRTPWGEQVQARARLFGRHNVLNAIASMASIHSYLLLKERNFVPFFQHEFAQAAAKPLAPAVLEALLLGIGSFEGVKRRFEFVGQGGDVTVFDDFAHHPTAIHTTLEAFRYYMTAAGRSGRLLACFDPRNATMRRRVLQNDVAKSFQLADRVYLGKVPQDLRIAEDERLDGPALARTVGDKATYFDDNEVLYRQLLAELQPGDTLVFMGPSGAFSGFPQRVVVDRQRS